MQALISIIIPVYNMERFLDRCVNSLINQTYPHLEIILINDGSKDQSPQICEQFAAKDKRVRVIHKENAGVSAARNSGLDIATGDYITFVDPDDWLEPRSYEIMIAHLLSKDIDILRFNAERCGETLNELPFNGDFEGERLQQEVLLPMIGAQKFGGMFILGVLWLHLIKRSIIELNHIRFNENIQRCEDRLFTITSLFCATRIIFIQDVLYHYMVNEDSLSNRYDPFRWEQELIYLDELKKEYRKMSPSFIEKANERIKSEYVLRAIATINIEFFSVNNNSFWYRYKRISLIINNENVKFSIKTLQREKLGWKGNLLLFFIKYRQTFLLTLLQTMILVGGKFKRRLK